MPEARFFLRRHRGEEPMSHLYPSLATNALVAGEVRIACRPGVADGQQEKGDFHAFTQANRTEVLLLSAP